MEENRIDSSSKDRQQSSPQGSSTRPSRLELLFRALKETEEKYSEKSQENSEK